MKPKSWMDALRVRKAKEWLASGQTVKEVAGEVGFKQAPQFCRYFKRRFGMTPQEFRKEELRDRKRDVGYC